MNSNMNLNVNLNHSNHVNNLNNSTNIPANNHNDKKKEDFNFEKLLISILEFKQETFKSLRVYSEFFKNYLNQNDSCYNTKEILEFMKKMEENRKAINENIQIQKNFISVKNRDRSAKLNKISDFINNYVNISNVLNRNKRKYKENVLMSNSESASLNFHLVQTLNKSNLLKEQMIKLDDSILKTKFLSKNLVSQEYELMNKILTSGRELTELNMETGKNKNELNNLKSTYSKYVEKSEYFKNIKSNIWTANQRNKTFLMRKLFHIRKINENLHISSQIKILSSDSSEKMENFTEEESLIFSEIEENSNSFFHKLTKNLNELKSEQQDLARSYTNEADNLKKRLCLLFCLISSNYNDIVIENFTEFNSNSLSFVEGSVKNVNDQIMNKLNKCANDLISCKEEYESVKTRVRTLNEKVIDAVSEKKNKKLIKKSFILLKNIFKTRKARKEQQQQLQQQVNAEREKITKENISTNLPTNNSRNYNENNFNPQQKTKRKRKESKEKKLQNKENRKLEKIPQNKIVMSNSKNILSSYKDETNYNFNFNYSNKKPSKVFDDIKAINNISNAPAINKKYALKCDIPLLVESFSKDPVKNYETSDFLQEISKNIHEVSEFTKNPTFGEKKKRILDNLKLI